MGRWGLSLGAVMLFFISCDRERGWRADADSLLNDGDTAITEEETLPDTALDGEGEPADEDALVASDEETDEGNDALLPSDENEVLVDESELPDADEAAPVLQGCLTGDFTPYFGNFHSHTGNSDGEGDPDQAFAYARDIAKLDILAVTDHLEQLYYYYTGIPSDEYPKCRESAVAASGPSFLALCGYEYGSGFEFDPSSGLDISTGHSNVFFNDTLLPMAQLDFHDFYASVAACPTCITQFNHPGDEGLKQTFHDFEFDTNIFFKMALYEFNGAGPVWDLFFTALAAGWWLSPTFNQDNHSANWGTADDHRTGVFMGSLDMASLYDAFSQRRTFATEDKNAVIRFMAEDDCWMGSRLSGLSSYSLRVEVSDPDQNDTFAAVELYDPMKNIIASHDCASAQNCEFFFELFVTMPTYVVARAIQSDGEVLVAAPIWMMP